jgi:hypothetical protein
MAQQGAAVALIMDGLDELARIAEKNAERNERASITSIVAVIREQLTIMNVVMGETVRSNHALTQRMIVYRIGLDGVLNFVAYTKGAFAVPSGKAVAEEIEKQIKVLRQCEQGNKQ